MASESKDSTGTTIPIFSPAHVTRNQPSEFESFTRALRHILSVKKSDLDLHKPIRPRKAKQKKSLS